MNKIFSLLLLLITASFNAQATIIDTWDFEYNGTGTTQSSTLFIVGTIQIDVTTNTILTNNLVIHSGYQTYNFGEYTEFSPLSKNFEYAHTGDIFLIASYPTGTNYQLAAHSWDSSGFIPDGTAQSVEGGIAINLPGVGWHVEYSAPNQTVVFTETDAEHTVAEPDTLFLLGTGLFGFYRRHRNNHPGQI